MNIALAISDKPFVFPGLGFTTSTSSDSNMYETSKRLEKSPYLTSFRGIAHPWLCDRLGHLNTRNYVAALDDAMQHYFALLGHHVDDRTGWADVAQNISYKREIPEGALFHVDAAITRIGTKSISYRQRIVLTAENEIAAVCDAVSVLFDLTDRAALPVPEAIVQNAGAQMLNGKEQAPGSERPARSSEGRTVERHASHSS
jgi:acyl-CoA thioester hydrolase